jgi:hypothetical protein
VVLARDARRTDQGRLDESTSHGLLKVRHGVIQEVGIVNQSLTNGPAAQLRLLRNF